MKLIRFSPLLLVFLILTACGGESAPTAPASTAIALPTGVNLPTGVTQSTADAQAVETAVTMRVLATLTASAQQPTAAVPLAVATVTPPPLPQTAVPTFPPPTLSVELSPSVTPVPERPTDVPRAAPAVPTTVPTQVPLSAWRDELLGKIIFKSARDNGQYPNSFEYYVMSADGQNQRKLPRGTAQALYDQLLALEGFSPDRQQLVLGEYACNSAQCQLYLGPRESIENRSQGVWTDGKYAATDPVWSPDGSNIAFVWTRDNERTKNIFRAPPETNPRFVRLTNFGGKRDTKHPTYSPDSAQIAFATQDGSRWQIWVVDAFAEGDCAEDNCPSNPRNLSHSSADDWDPLWVK